MEENPGQGNVKAGLVKPPQGEQLAKWHDSADKSQTVGWGGGRGNLHGRRSESHRDMPFHGRNLFIELK